MKASIKAIAAAAISSIEPVLNQWAPGGKRQGHEYLALNPTRSDSKPGSFSINLNTGAWADFATGDKGGDLVALVAYIEGKKQGEAAKLLAEFMGIKMGNSDPQNSAAPAQNKPASACASTQAKAPAWRAVQPVPDDAPPPPAAHPTHGEHSMRWAYRDSAGRLLCWVHRFEPKGANSRKQFCPLTWCESADGRKHAWRWQGLLDPRPLYRLDQLAARPESPVVVCEGEKAADAAALLLPGCVTVTMLNGAQAPAKTDWAPLAGRTVWLWPDNDQPGTACMASVANLAREAGATEVLQINLAAFGFPASDHLAGYPDFTEAAILPDRWDAADALADGWTDEHLDKLLKRPDFLREVQTVPAPAPAASNATAQDNTEIQPSRFHCNADGVWYFGKSEQGNDAPALWICSKLEVVAVTRDAKNESWGRLLEFADLDATPHTWAMPMDMTRGDGAEYRGVLLSMGLQIAPSTKARNLLTQYILTAPVEQRARCVSRTGWHEGAFVMPERTLGDTEERILYQTDAAAPSTFKARGKLSDWQGLAQLCSGNSRLVFAMSAAFAAPLLEISGVESGGFHFRGDSSTGKTTALRVAASVWGGMDYLQRWRATDNGLEALAAQHSDCLLVLDELSQVDPKAAGEVAYMLSNGQGKARANRTGTMRETATWRLLFISSGEAGLAEHMALANKKPKAGQEVRLLDIPADAGAGFGMFEALHDYADGAAFSKAITDAAGKHYGAAALAFLQKLVQNRSMVAQKVKAGQQHFKTLHVPNGAGGQVERAAMRFALVGVAGELARVWEVTGWQPGEALAAAEICFKAWLSQRGSAGNLEELQMLQQVRRFFELHGEARFTDWERPASDTSQHPPRTINRAGYRKHYDAKDENGNRIYLEGLDKDGLERTAKETKFYVYPETFKAEVCAGFDYRAVCKLLVRRGALMPDGRGFTRKERLPGGEGNMHVFHVTPRLWVDDDVMIDNQSAHHADDAAPL